MKIVIAFLACIAVTTAFDCFGQNNNCTGSHIACDTGYQPFCEHDPDPIGRIVGICTCDKSCTSAADCANPLADGCPAQSHPVCDTSAGICHCFGRPPIPDSEDTY